MGLQSRSVFVSYSHKDKELVLPVINAQHALAWSAFIDNRDTGPGSDWKEVHERRIVSSERFILCWSKDAACSAEVEREWRLALESDVTIIPVLLDGTPLHQCLNHIHAIDLRDYVRSNCRPMSLDVSIWGTVLLTFGLILAGWQTFQIVDDRLSGARVFLALIGLLMGYVGWRIVKRWVDWLKLKAFVDKKVIEDLQGRHEP